MKIVFIMNGLDPRFFKRIHEFSKNGYEVEAYGFSRNGMIADAQKFKLEVIGDIQSIQPYYKRVGTLRNGIQKVVNYYSGKKVVYYLFQLDIAMVFKMCTFKNNYIYEESDLRHTYMKNPLKAIMERIDKYIIKKSIMSVFTSEGFLDYHYPNKRPVNTYVIPNRLHPNILEIEEKEKVSQKGLLSVGFVGAVRYNAILNFIEVFCYNFPEYQMHVFGYVENEMEDKFKSLTKYKNLKFHGAFKNPDDLPIIYSKIDVVLSTYDAEYDNVRYAEPNKLYEAIYFNTPIIVSKNTFLETKVLKYKIGYSVDAKSEQDIIQLIKDVNETLNNRIENCRKIDKKECVNLNQTFFERLKKELI